ncbi:MAG: IPTL-CTERM sorting domain-containing protein, partial [Burkholderiales bacterium]|nr:IPTL-CTERM sorting domain-containing protein [Burkholderiales bacterium]
VTDDDQPVGVPTMSMLGLGFMSLMLAGFVAFQRRRVQK